MKKVLLFVALFFATFVLVACGETTISFEKESITLEAGDEETLKYTVSDKDAVLEWSSSAVEIVEVDGEGKVKALEPGVAEVTVTIKDTDISAVITITVTLEPVIYKIEVSIYNYENEEVFKEEVVFDEDDNLKDLLINHEDIQMKGEESDFGFYIVEMYDISSNDYEQTFWNVKVNGEDSMVGISLIELVNGDKISFHLIGW